VYDFESPHDAPAARGKRGRMGKMESALIKDQVREFIMTIAVRRGVPKVADDDSLTSTGVLSSMAIFRLVSFVEETFSVAIDDDEITSENFGSINAIQEFVLGKLD
jgi:acyl carrier protein